MSEKKKVTDRQEFYEIDERDRGVFNSMRGGPVRGLTFFIDEYANVWVLVDSVNSLEPEYLPISSIDAFIDSLSDKNAAYFYNALVERFKRKMIGG